jgi:HEPN domain-containing protein
VRSPAGIRKLYRVSERRLQAAEFLLNHGFHLEATYLAGYAVECALKALVLKRTPKRQYAATWGKLTGVGAKGHDFEYLRHLLKEVGCSFPRHVSDAMRRVAGWTTNLRYEVIEVGYHQAETFLEAARGIQRWSEAS